ncbi:MAG: hypothetical protein AB1563_07525 [Bacillota bacterium]
MNTVACELFAAATCNMACAYCYIPKTPTMGELHRRVTSELSSGRWIETLKQVVGEQLEHIGFWGTEPTLILDFVTPQVPDILGTFPNLKNVGFSTNLLQRPEVICDFARALSAHTDKVKLDVQVSLDGPEWVTDENRHPGAVAAITANLRRLFEDLGSGGPGITVAMRFKPTLTVENMRAMDDQRIGEWFSFFDGLLDMYAVTVRDKEHLQFAPEVTPTFVVPGRYTSDDGRDVAAFFERVWRLEQRHQRKRMFKYIRGSLNQYVKRFQRLVRYHGDFMRHPSMMTCSAGDTNMGLGLARVHICHRTFMLDQPEYVASVERTLGNWDVSLFEQGRISIANRFIADADAKRELARLWYVMRNYHDFYTLQVSYGVALLKELAAAGQVSPVYGECEELAALLALFVATAFSCPAENLLNTGCLHFSPVSLFRLLGNGAFESILEQYLAGERAAA